MKKPKKSGDGIYILLLISVVFPWLLWVWLEQPAPPPFLWM